MIKTSLNKIIVALLLMSFTTQLFASVGMPCQKQSDMNLAQDASMSMEVMDHSEHANMDVSTDSDKQMDSGVDCCQDCDCSDGCFMTALINTSKILSKIEHHQWVSPYFSSMTTAITNTLYRPPIAR